MSKAKKAPSKAMVAEAVAIAHEMGFTYLNQQEKQLIDLLRFTTYHGRNLVIETAIAMRRAHPWRDHPAAQHDNTATSFPANDCRFFVATKEN